MSQGDGVVGVGGSDEGAAVLVTSDTNGIAATRYRLGARAGSGNQRVTARAVGFEGEVVFFASATPKPGDKVSVNSGNNQRGAARQPLPLPFIVVVSDDGANVIEGAQVEFRVVAGDGRLQNGEREFIASTDSDGRASAKLTLGEELGLDVHRVSAQLVGTQLSARLHRLGATERRTRCDLDQRGGARQPGSAAAERDAAGGAHHARGQNR